MRNPKLKSFLRSLRRCLRPQTQLKIKHVDYNIGRSQMHECIGDMESRGYAVKAIKINYCSWEHDFCAVVRFGKKEDDK